MKIRSDIFNLCLYDVHKYQKYIDNRDLTQSMSLDEISEDTNYTKLLEFFLYRLAVDPGFFASLIPSISSEKIIRETIDHINALKYKWTYSTAVGCFSSDAVKYDGDFDEILKEIKSRYTYLPSQYIYPARGVLNPKFITNYFTAVGPGDDGEVHYSEIFLMSQASNAFEIQNGSINTNIDAKNGSAKIINAWLKYYHKNIRFGREMYKRVSPDNLAAYLTKPDDIKNELNQNLISSLNPLNNINSPANIAKKEQYFSLFDHALIYTAPWAFELRKKFAEIQELKEPAEILTPEIIFNFKDEDAKSYFSYLKFTTDALTIACEQWFHDTYVENRQELLNILNTETPVDTSKCIVWMQELPTHYLLWITAKLIRNHYIKDAKNLCDFILDKNGISETELFYANLLKADILSQPEIDQTISPDAEIYIKKALKYVRQHPRGSGNMPPLYSFSYNHWAIYTDMLNDLIKCYSKNTPQYPFDKYFKVKYCVSDSERIEGLYALSKILRRLGSYEEEAQCLNTIFEDKDFKEMAFGSDTTDILLKMFDWSGIKMRVDYLNSSAFRSIVSQYDDFESFYYCDYMNMIHSNLDSVTQELFYDFQVSRAVETLSPIINPHRPDFEQLIAISSQMLLPSYYALSSFDNAYQTTQDLIKSPELKLSYINEAGLSLILGHHYVEGIEKLKDDLSIILQDESIDENKKMDVFEGFIFRTIEELYGIQNNNLMICKEVCNELYRVLLKNTNIDTAAIWMSKALGNQHWSEIAEDWFADNPEKNVSSEDAKVMVLFEVARFDFNTGKFGAAENILNSLMYSPNISGDQRSAVIEKLATVYQLDHKFLLAKRLRGILSDSVSADIHKTLNQTLERILTLDEISSELARNYFTLAQKESRMYTVNPVATDEIDCTNIMRNYGVGLESYLDELIGKELKKNVQSKFMDSITPNLCYSIRGWGDALLSGGSRTLTLGTWANLSKDLAYLHQDKVPRIGDLGYEVKSYILQYIEKEYSPEQIEAVTMISEYLKSYRNEACHGAKQILMSQEEFKSVHAQIVDLLNNLINQFTHVS